VPRASWMTKRPPAPSLTATQVAVQFAAQLQAGYRPSIEAALDRVTGSEWADLLHSLLIAEVNARRARGENPTTRDYLPRFPAHTHVVRAVLPADPSPSHVPGFPPPCSESPAEVVEPNAVPATDVPAAMPVLARTTAGPSSPMVRRRHRQHQIAGSGLFVLVAAATAVPLMVFPRPQSLTETPHAAPAPPAKAAINLFPKPVANDPERDLAEWVVSVGGRGTVLPDGASRRPFGGEAPLPKVKFAVTAVVLPPESAGRWKPNDLDRFRGRNRLVSVELHAASPLTEPNLAPLTGLPLKALELHAPAVEASGAILAGFPDLDTLVLSNCRGFGDTDLAAVGRLNSLSALTLNTAKLTADGLRELRCPALKTLRFGPDVALSADHLRVLQRLPLEELECAAEVSDDAFVELALCLELKRLRLHRAAITDAGMRAVAGLGKLEEFCACGSAVRGPGLEHLADCKSLRVLDLTGGKLTNDAVEALLGLPALRSVRLAGNPLTDDAAILLAELERVELLDLGETGITDGALATLKEHPTLKTLIVTNTRVTYPGVRDFEAGTPTCKVIYGKRP